MRSIVATIAVVTLGVGGGCSNVPADYPEDCPPEGTPNVSDVGVEVGGTLDVKGADLAKMAIRERDPELRLRQREAEQEGRQARKELAARARCPTRPSVPGLPIE